MATIASDLDWCQGFLKDTYTLGVDGQLWTRAELLGYYNDGYRKLVNQAMNVKRWTVLEVPPRATYALTYAWEDRYIQNGTFHNWTMSPSGRYACSSLFELDIAEGYSQSLVGSEGITQGWERTFLNPAYLPFRFMLPRNHLRVVKMWYAHRLLFPLGVIELDWTYQNWYSLGNYPLAWVPGAADDRTYDLYEIQTTDTYDYAIRRDSQYFNTVSDGMLRSISGSRTYGFAYDDNASKTIAFAWTCEGDANQLQNVGTLPYTKFFFRGPGMRVTGDPATGNYQGIHAWEKEQLNGVARASQTVETKPVGCFPWESRYGASVLPLGYGPVRAIESPDRQYWPIVAWHDQIPLGKLDDIHSSNALMVLEDIEPDAPLLTPGDTPGLLPPQLQKYLRCYVLFRAFNRQGEGYNPAMAELWQRRYLMGEQVLRRFGWIQRQDKNYARQPVHVRTRPPRPHLPSHYPSIW